MSEPDNPGFDPDEEYGVAVAKPEQKSRRYTESLCLMTIIRLWNL